MYRRLFDTWQNVSYESETKWFKKWSMDTANKFHLITSSKPGRICAFTYITYFFCAMSHYYKLHRKCEHHGHENWWKIRHDFDIRRRNFHDECQRVRSRFRRVQEAFESNGPQPVGNLCREIFSYLGALIRYVSKHCSIGALEQRTVDQNKWYSIRSKFLKKA